MHLFASYNGGQYWYAARLPWGGLVGRERFGGAKGAGTPAPGGLHILYRYGGRPRRGPADRGDRLERGAPDGRATADPGGAGLDVPRRARRERPPPQAHP